MNDTREVLNFEVLGFRIKFKPDEGYDKESATKIVDEVLKASQKLKDKLPQLDQGQIAILTALQMASDRISLENEYRVNIDKLRSEASDALGFIEDISPSS